MVKPASGQKTETQSTDLPAQKTARSRCTLYIPVALAVIILIGSLTATGLLFRQLGNWSFGIAAAGTSIMIGLLCLQYYRCKASSQPTEQAPRPHQEVPPVVESPSISQPQIPQVPNVEKTPPAPEKPEAPNPSSKPTEQAPRPHQEVPPPIESPSSSQPQVPQVPNVEKKPPAAEKPKVALQNPPPFDTAKLLQGFSEGPYSWFTARDIFFYLSYFAVQFPQVKFPVANPCFPLVKGFTMDVDIGALIDKCTVSDPDLDIPIPINCNNSHWTCVYVDRKRKTIEYFNSFGSCDEYMAKELKSVAQRLGKSDGKPYSFIPKMEIKIQTEDTWQCGPWILYFLEQRIINPDFDFNAMDVEEAQNRIEKFRKNVKEKELQIMPLLNTCFMEREAQLVQKLGKEEGYKAVDNELGGGRLTFPTMKRLYEQKKSEGIFSGYLPAPKQPKVPAKASSHSIDREGPLPVESPSSSLLAKTPLSTSKQEGVLCLKNVPVPNMPSGYSDASNPRDWFTMSDMYFYFSYLALQFPQLTPPNNWCNLPTVFCNSAQGISTHLDDYTKNNSDLGIALLINMYNLHWVFAYVDRKKGVIEYYDSKVDFGYSALIEDELKKNAQKLKNSDGKPYSFVRMIKKELQTDGHQCGPWSLYFLEQRLINPDFDFDSLDVKEAQSMIAEFRKKVISKRSAIVPYLSGFYRQREAQIMKEKGRVEGSKAALEELTSSSSSFAVVKQFYEQKQSEGIDL